MIDNDSMLHAVPSTSGRRVWPTDWKGDGNGDKGVRCRKCGCGHLEVRNTVPITGGMIRRYKVCRNCGTVRTTHEG
jgi:hypothetical protein